MTRKVFALCALSLILGSLTACKKYSDDAKVQAGKMLYHCAMHPQIVSDKPGECPICHMTLVPFQPQTPPARRILFYRNPMDPKVTSPVPMKDSMGMDFVPVYSDESAGGASIPGQASIQMDPAAEQRIGVKTTEAAVRDLEARIQAAARIAYDPQLYSAALEHQEAVKFLTSAQGAPSREQAQATVHSSRLRLRQMGLSDSQIEDISKPGYDPSSLLVGSKGGKVWAYLDVFDDQASLVRQGQTVELTSPALPGKVFQGTVQAIDPVVNSETRTVKVRAKVPDPNGELRPGIYLSGVIHGSGGTALAVPDTAVIDTGSRQLVYVQTAPGSYEPRKVRVGRQASGFSEITEGLKAGEKVVTAANFFIDSESRIQAAGQGAENP
jgi:Cu(I)/Ag(I) efflux system membrane fusion protein